MGRSPTHNPTVERETKSKAKRSFAGDIEIIELQTEDRDPHQRLRHEIFAAGATSVFHLSKACG